MSKRNNKRQEVRNSSIMVVINVSFIVWCLCLIAYGLICRNAWVYIFLIINSVSVYYYVNKMIDLLRE